MKMSTYKKLSAKGKKRADVVYSIESAIYGVAFIAGLAVMANLAGFAIKVLGL